MVIPEMKALLVAAFAALCFSFGGRVSTVHNFDSGSLQPVISGSIDVPGARPGVQAVVLTVEYYREYSGWYANSDAMTSVLISGFPKATVGIAGGIISTLEPYFASAALTPLEFWPHQSGVATTEFSVTFTDPLILQEFVGRQLSIPLGFAGGYTMTANGGQGSSSIETKYGWSGTIQYLY